MNPKGKTSAKEIVNQWSEKDIGDCLRDFGEERRWKQAAKAIVDARKKKTIETTRQLAEIVMAAIPQRGKKIHPATQVFQALRVCVNRELESLEEGIKQALGFLKKGGIMGAISFHSLEDRIVKNIFREAAQPPRDMRGKRTGQAEFASLTKKPITPRLRESRTNRRARSAKMRFLQKL